ncbi:hypothetical protein MJO28_004681 [Puccinia striiformis f. sp. tritici]|uniref:Uncharacterized protein n=3 Tax=Puccinia striiformis TaxID=27350 RepID=A0A0L0UUQ6_9BASI|nr:hypothetical protein Pst134EA_006723 [Puccinia striiformis f. sp. tritici]KAI9616654.1 hypothetical protein KEM48_005164 [Puccinia striiformis f. sp. tritici PST-130]KNE90671.1 hypothetical protein PSTG_15883 [Puccinia striiformis f. sp. tritici PST-78]POW01727.1 hypothetical protein PSTT_12287 [Puccinia striiformis]KAH9459666.1 hypothetical protein Pst134EB_007896 [Puccinia striiformis f. sp. tritici]KAH9469433.1 hypothetical protein Pst134EA_006723 [Puccinia striiformis f. sp. tritici]
MPAFLHHKPPVISRLAWSLLLLSTLLAGVTPQDSLGHNSPIQHFRKRQLPTQTGSSPLPSGLFDSPGSNRGLDPTKTSPSTPPPADPAAPAAPSSPSPSPSPSPSNNTTNTTNPLNPSLSDPLLPLLGSASPLAPAPTSSPSPAPNNPNRPILPSSSSLTTTSSASVASPTPITPGRGQLPPTDPSTTVSPASSPTASADPSNNRTPKQAPHKSDDSSSGFGSTTIKTIGIIAAVIAGLFLLWTIIRKWKFSPSKRFAKKLDDYDEDVFAPRPPSFGEKRANDYQAYSIPPPPNTGPAFSSHYPSYLPERTATPHSMMSPQKIPYANDPCGPQGYQSHRLSHVSITQPPAMFEPNPYRLSLGLGNIPHAYPPSDQHKATVM